MANIPVGYTVCTATLQCVGATRPCVITQAFGGSGGISAATIRTSWKAAISGSSTSPFAAANMDSNWSLIQTYALQQTTSVAQTSSVDLSPVVGTATIATPAQNTAVLVHKKTIYSGRRYRGRISAPPANIGEGSITRAGTIDTTPLGVQQDYWNYVFAYMTTAGCNPVLLHYPTTLPDGGDFPPAPTSLTNYTVSALVGTFGSRLR